MKMHISERDLRGILRSHASNVVPTITELMNGIEDLREEIHELRKAVNSLMEEMGSLKGNPNYAPPTRRQPFQAQRDSKGAQER